MKSIIKVAFTYSAIEGLQKGLYFLILPILSYYISPQEYGNISIVFSIILVFQMLFAFSLESTIMRYYPKFKVRKMKKNFLGTIFFSSLLFSVIWLVLLIMIGPIIFKFILPSLPFYPYIILAMLIAMFKLINFFYISFLKTIQDLKNFTIFYNLYFLLQTGLILILVILINYKKDLLYLYGLLIAQIIMFIIVFFKIKKFIAFNINSKILKFCLSYSFIIIPIKIFNTINSSIDRYLLFNFLGNTMAGIYFFGWQIASALQIIVMALNSAYVPKFFKLYEKNKKNGNFFAIYKILHIIIFLVLVFESFFLNIYNLAFNVISSYYYEASKVIPLFILYFSFSIIYFINTNALSLNSDLNRKKIIGIFIGIILNIIISLVLMKKYNIIGVAIGTIVGQITSIFYYMHIVSTYTRFKFKNLFYMFFIILIFICNYFISEFYLRIVSTFILLTIYYLKVNSDAKKH